MLKFRDVGVIKVSEVGDGRDTADHVDGDGLSHPRHLLTADWTPVVALRRTRLTGSQSRRRVLHARLPHSGNHIFTNDPTSRPTATDPPQINAQLSRQPSHSRPSWIDGSRLLGLINPLIRLHHG